MKYNVKLSGVLTTLSPVTIVPPSAVEMTHDKSKYKQIASTIIYVNGLREARPIIPGTTLRGRFRRSAVDVYLGLSGVKIPLPEWHQNAVGGIKGSESESAFDVVFRDAIRQKNPVLSLFGAGAPWINGKANIGNAVPTHAVERMLVSGVRSDDGRRNDDFFVKLDDSAVDEWVSLITANSARTKHKDLIKTLRRDLQKSRNDKKEADVTRLTAELQAAEKDEAAVAALASNPVSMPLLHEAMPTGVTLDHDISLTAVTLEEIGLFFAAFNGFMKAKPAVGQHESMGYGLFGGSYNIQVEEVSAFDPFKFTPSEDSDIGTLTIKPFAGFSDVPTFIADAMSAFKAAFEEGKYDFSVVKPEAPVKKEKKKKGDAKVDGSDPIEALEGAVE